MVQKSISSINGQFECRLRRMLYKKQGGNSFFRVFLSTPRLLQSALQGDIIHADATYKLVWQGFPVFVVGTSDKNRKFFPTGIAICTNETANDFQFMLQSLIEGVFQIGSTSYLPQILIADAADANTNGFGAVFGNGKKCVFCWAHVIRAVDRKLEKIKDPHLRQQLCGDILQLQLSTSPTIFHTVTLLFFDKWSVRNNAEVNDFLSYFKSKWVDQCKTWYEGFALGAPSTNNGLEAINLTINTEQTMRDRLPLSRFMHLLSEKILVQWSEACVPSNVNHKVFETTATKDTVAWTAAYQWATSSPSILAKSTTMPGVKLYYIAASNKLPVTFDLATSFRSLFTDLSWQSFDDYVNIRNAIWVVNMDEGSWATATCTCPTYLKEFHCKHTLGLAIRLKYCDRDVKTL